MIRDIFVQLSSWKRIKWERLISTRREVFNLRMQLEANSIFAIHRSCISLIARGWGEMRSRFRYLNRLSPRHCTAATFSLATVFMSALAPASPPGRLHGGDEDATKLISIQMHYRRFQIDCKYFNFIYFLLRESSNTREDYRKDALHTITIQLAFKAREIYKPDLVSADKQRCTFHLDSDSASVLPFPYIYSAFCHET